MTTPLWIWSTYHGLAFIAQLFSSKRNNSAAGALIVISWMAGFAMLWSGHTGWFLWTNIPLILMMILFAAGHLTKPPAGSNEEEAQSAMWAAAVRLAVVLACWAL